MRNMDEAYIGFLRLVHFVVPRAMHFADSHRELRSCHLLLLPEAMGSWNRNRQVLTKFSATRYRGCRSLTAEIRRRTKVTLVTLPSPPSIDNSITF